MWKKNLKLYRLLRQNGQIHIWKVFSDPASSKKGSKQDPDIGSVATFHSVSRRERIQGLSLGAQHRRQRLLAGRPVYWWRRCCLWRICFCGHVVLCEARPARIPAEGLAHLGYSGAHHCAGPLPTVPVQHRRAQCGGPQVRTLKTDSGYVLCKGLYCTDYKQSNVYGAQESIPRNRFRQPWNRFLGSLKGIQIRAQEARKNKNAVCTMCIKYR